jgi:hypothetical protein
MRLRATLFVNQKSTKLLQSVMSKWNAKTLLYRNLSDLSEIFVQERHIRFIRGAVFKCHQSILERLKTTIQLQDIRNTFMKRKNQCIF